MTKKQLRRTYDNWNKEITKLGERKTQILHELQELCEEKTGYKTSSFTGAVESLIKAGSNFRTMALVSEYYRIEGQEEALKKLALATNNFDI